MDDLTAEESARRVRAVIAYAGIELSEVEKRTGIKATTLRNYTSPSRPTRASLEKRQKIAKACGVPTVFMEAGFTPDANGELPAKLQKIEERLGRLELWRAAVELEARRRRGGEGHGDPPAQPGPQP